MNPLRNPATEERVKMALFTGTAMLLPAAILTKTPHDDAALMRVQGIILDPVKWNLLLDMLLGPK